MTTISPQPGPQTDLLRYCNVDTILMAGSRGSGKSYALALDILSYLQYPTELHQYAHCLVLRRTFQDLKQLIETLKQVFQPFGVTYNQMSKIMTFPSGITIQLGYLDNSQDLDRYQGFQFSAIYIDEIAQLPSMDLVLPLYSCLRPMGNLPPDLKLPDGWFRMRWFCNPGGILADALIDFFKIREYPNGHQILIDDQQMTRLYIPAQTEQNKIMLKIDPKYQQRIGQLKDEKLKAAWLYGDWFSYSGLFFNYFNRAQSVKNFSENDIRTMLLHADKHIFALDWGFSPDRYSGQFILYFKHSTSVSESFVLPQESVVVICEISGNNCQVKDFPPIVNKQIEYYTKLLPHGRNASWLKVADPSIFCNFGLGSIAATLADNGLVLNKAINTRTAGWDTIKSYMRGRQLGTNDFLTQFFVSSQATWLISDITAARPDEKKPGDLESIRNESGHLDSIDALRYGVMCI